MFGKVMNEEKKFSAGCCHRHMLNSNGFCANGSFPANGTTNCDRCGASIYTDTRRYLYRYTLNANRHNIPPSIPYLGLWPMPKMPIAKQV